ncbi:hypothetical protein L6164_008995 [Bauhinia variegata]|uniref:Uncharacterized protein n=1 Tax=Bauhinia variegata TaxID=167791 RepID=A0ACB9PHL6_BAUVA|nr:hypothetical protein L6164_008995 [Bauhinia variegata]
MGESACLMQPFCYASGISNEANESNPIHALGQSVSFGRFNSESLSWERWSTFSHNRYVEEAERYSRPGSVAQKKAFFEAHYKKLAAQKAAALLEQANNAASNNVQEQQHEGAVDDVVKTHDSQTCPNSEQVAQAINSDPDVMFSSTGHDSNSSKSESSRINGADPEREQEASVAMNSMKVEQQNLLQDVDNSNEVNEKIIRTPRMEKPKIKQSTNSDQEVSAAKSKKKPSVSSAKLLKDNGASKFTSTPAKYTTPFPSSKDNFATPMSNKPGLGSTDKKRATPRSLHMTVNFTPIRELNRLTASVMRRFETSRAGAASSKPSKDSSTLLRTPTMASKNESKNHASVTPLKENTRTKTPVGSSVSGSKTGPKWRLLSAEKKMRSPIISSPFSLRTEERAARRKKKLEEKFNANEAQKVQLHTKLKEKAETEMRKLRQSFCFKARLLPDFYKEIKASKNEITKEPLTYPDSSPKGGRKPSCSVVENKSSLPSVKSKGTKIFLGKNDRTSSHPLSSNSMMISHENTSPNILHQIDWNYK